jgi:ubiquinone/menaquinone biosynthesis C-methylase UbiE
MEREKISKDPYRRSACLYDTIFEPMNRGLRVIGIRMFPPDRTMAILDVGCGTGAHLEMYQRYGCSLHGIDTSPSMFEVAKARLGNDADLRLTDASQMPYDDRAFDFVFCMLTLHEMDDTVRASVIGEIKRVLKREGRILFIDFHVGKPQPIMGWVTKLVILLSEIGGGRRHFRNYRQFMSIGGLPALIRASRLSIEQEKVVGGDTLALYLLRAG